MGSNVKGIFQFIDIVTKIAYHLDHPAGTSHRVPRFIREVLSGAYESDMGLWPPTVGKVARFRHKVGADNR